MDEDDESDPGKRTEVVGEARKRVKLSLRDPRSSETRPRSLCRQVGIDRKHL
jgi:hypothetical protein